MRVLVTGGGTGIGRATVGKLAAQGARIVIAGRRGDVLDQVALAHPGQIHALSCDLEDATQRTGLVAKAASLLGGLDALVHAAGVVFHEPPGSISDAHLRSQLELNLVAPMRLGEEALRVLAPGGSLVFVGSTLAIRPVVTSMAYSAAKAGLLQVMKVLALAGAPRDIRANAVVPGVVDTDMIRVPRTAPGELLDQAEAPARVAAQLDSLKALHPIGRLGTPDDVAGAIVYLLASPWITGTELVVDGGLLLHG